MSLASILNRANRRSRRDGLLATVRACVSTFLPADFYVYRMEALRPLPGTLPRLSICRGLEALREAREGHAALPDEFYYDERPEYRDCFVALFDGAPVGIQWVLHGPLPLPHIALAERQAELCGLHVLAPVRGKGIGRSLVRAACAALMDEGVSDIYTTVARTNLASQHCTETVGFRRIARWRRPPFSRERAWLLRLLGFGARKPGLHTPPEVAPALIRAPTVSEKQARIHAEDSFGRP